MSWPAGFCHHDVARLVWQHVYDPCAGQLGALITSTDHMPQMNPVNHQGKLCNFCQHNVVYREGCKCLAVSCQALACTNGVSAGINVIHGTYNLDAAACADCNAAVPMLRVKQRMRQTRMPAPLLCVCTAGSTASTGSLSTCSWPLTGPCWEDNSLKVGQASRAAHGFSVDQRAGCSHVTLRLHSCEAGPMGTA